MKFSENHQFFQAFGSRFAWPNPGRLSKIHQNYQNIEPVWNDGVHFRYQNALNPSRVFFLQTLISETRPSGVRFGCAFRPMDSKSQFVLKTPSLVLDVSPMSLSTNISLLSHPIESLRLKLKAQMEVPRDRSERQKNAFWVFPMMRLESEWTDRSSTISLGFQNSGPNSGKITASSFQKICDSIDIGSEMTFDWQAERGLRISKSIAARYVGRDTAFATTISITKLDFNMSYFKQVNKCLQIGSTISFNRELDETTAAVCYQYDFYDAIVRGKGDSDGCFGVTYDRDVGNYNFGISLLFNARANKLLCGFRFGCDATERK